VENRSVTENADLPVVTLSGECFKAAFQRKETAGDRDGVLYLFELEDLKGNRGVRLVQLFRSGQDKAMRPNHDAVIDRVRINKIRRAFDSGDLNFDAEYEEHRYQEIIIRSADFEAVPAKADTEIRQFIKHKAYWLGYRFNPHSSPLLPVELDTPVDLEYLGVKNDSVIRAVWLLGQEGMLDKIMGGFGRPTHTFINNYERAMNEQEARQESRGTEDQKVTDSRKVFLVHGHDQAMESKVARFLERLKLIPIVLHEQANKGKTIIEKFESHSSDVGFAVVLLSPDDVGSLKGEKHLSPRARQNVILELGYFIGKLGRGNVCALHTGDVELPSDLHGILWVPFDPAWQLILAREIKGAGIKVDLNDI
jgi:predicted nucleotide-binding protein